MFDSDAEIETNNKVILRNTKPCLPIICEQKSSEKVVVTEKGLRMSNKNGFGNKVGSITNKVTTMFELLPLFEKDSEEYKELERRIICGQALQQEEIDKIKGIKAKQMPKSWYSYKVNKILEEDYDEVKKEKEFNLKIMVNKKPYFFIYNYEDLWYDYQNFQKNAETTCWCKFNKSLTTLFKQEYHTDEEIEFMEWYNHTCPVFQNASTMNKICWYLEDKFKDTKELIREDEPYFDYEIYKTDKPYSPTVFNRIKEEVFNSVYKSKYNNNLFYNPAEMDNKIESMRLLAYQICPNEEDLCNICVDIAYATKSNRSFAWYISKDQIIANLLAKNNNTYTIPILSDDEGTEWNGDKYTMMTYSNVIELV